VGGITALVLAYFIRRRTASPGIHVDNQSGLDGWRKSETDSVKPTVESPLTDEELADENRKIAAELAARNNNR
jgi:hypothetical protein